MRIPLSLRIQMYLASHPRAANRLLGLMGAERVEATGRQAALKAARLAYEHAPFYRQLFTDAGFTAEQMRRLTWDDFQRLPIVQKDILEGVEAADLLDKQIPSPLGDALIGRSSGTTRAPMYWPLGWSEFYVTRAAFAATLRDLGVEQGVPTAVVLTNAVEGGDQSGNMPYRAFFSLKEQKGWNLEVVATGEDSATIHAWLHWLAQHGYSSLFLISFPGTMERLLDYIDKLPEAERVNWDAFTRKHVLMGGQIVARPIRQRVRRSMHLDPDSLTSESVVYVSSDTGQLMARSTRFTLWLERYIERHPDLYPALELTEEHGDKPLLEFLPPMSIQFEIRSREGIIITLWKHRPLVRYAIGDLVWTRPAPELLDKLSRITPTWRRDFLAAGGHPLDIPRVATFGVVLGRADEICIVNGANISPAMVQRALENAGIAARINYFKHFADPTHPNAYHLAVELTDAQNEQARRALAEQWRGKILDALLAVPAATDLVAAHRTNPIEFFLVVRSRGEDEFRADGQPKRTHAMRMPPMFQRNNDD